MKKSTINNNSYGIKLPISGNTEFEREVTNSFKNENGQIDQKELYEAILQGGFILSSPEYEAREQILNLLPLAVIHDLIKSDELVPDGYYKPNEEDAYLPYFIYEDLDRIAKERGLLLSAHDSEHTF